MIDLVGLKKLCDEYDSIYGDYPESRREGEAVYQFAVERLTKTLGEIKSEIE